jgi:stage II sporulation protein D
MLSVVRTSTMSIRKTVLLCCAHLLFFNCTASAEPLSMTKALFALAETSHKNGRYLEALSFYRDVLLNSEPSGIPADLYKNMGDIYADYLESYAQALACYRKQAELFPGQSSTPDVHLRIARMLYLQGQQEQARAHYRFICAAFPDYAKKSSLAEELQRIEKREQPFQLKTVSIEQPLPGYIRVLLKDDTAPAELSAPGGLRVYTDRQALVLTIPDGTLIYCRPDKVGIAIDNHAAAKTPLRIEAAAGAGIQVNNKMYRGTLWAHLQEGRLMLVNHVLLEEYLYGVLAKEVPASWPAAALQAQAVAARTYALYNVLKNAPALFDVYSTTASQAYGGLDSEKSASRKAVDETRGIVLSYGKKLALPLYHANSGGMTETPEDVWGWSAPYLAAQQDGFSRDTKNFEWDCSLAAADLSDHLCQAGFPLPAVETIMPLQRDRSGRITRLGLQADKRTAYLSGNSFRLLAGPGKIKSAHFTVERNNQSFIFNGSGYGHGVGMSQWGAYGMARQGYRAEQILRWYYPGTAIIHARFQSQQQMEGN